MLYFELQTVLLVELVNAAAGVNELLLTGVEGVALGADFNGDVLLGAAGLDDLAASAADGGLLIVGVNSGFHNNFSCQLSCFEYAPQRMVTKRKANYSIYIPALQEVLKQKVR